MGQRTGNREMLFVVGATVEEKFLAIEQAFQRMRRRLHKTVTAVMPPTIVHGYCAEPDAEGVIFRGFFPVAGKLISAGLYIGEYCAPEKKPVTFYCDLISPTDRGGLKFVTLKKQLVEKFDLAVPECSRIRIRVDDPSLVKDVWIGLALEVAQSDMQVRQFLIKDIDNLIVDAESEAENEGI